jgi:AbrB family looped-hinge helix DNA binding protein
MRPLEKQSMVIFKYKTRFISNMNLCVEFTRASASGQVVIPKKIRERMKISASDRFMVVGGDDTILFKRVDQEAIKNSFTALSASLQEGAKKSDLKPKDITDAIKWARKTKK